MATRDIIVVGASAGGVDALTRMVGQLPAEFPATVLAALHISPLGKSFLADILSRAGPLQPRKRMTASAWSAAKFWWLRPIGI